MQYYAAIIILLYMYVYMCVYVWDPYTQIYTYV